jgi:hypothetical protein
VYKIGIIDTRTPNSSLVKLSNGYGPNGLLKENSQAEHDRKHPLNPGESIFWS